MGRGQKKAVKILKAERGFERNPPRCFNCIYFSKEVRGIPNIKQYKPSTCTDGKFAVEENSICDIWNGKDGSILIK